VQAIEAFPIGSAPQIKAVMARLFEPLHETGLVGYRSPRLLLQLMASPSFAKSDRSMVVVAGRDYRSFCETPSAGIDVVSRRGRLH
jgi:hypothetical protein